MSKMQNKYLSVIAYANGWTMWLYNDYKLEYKDISENFFGSIHNLTRTGDKILIVCKDKYFEVIVSEIKGDVVKFVTLTSVDLTTSGEYDE